MGNEEGLELTALSGSEETRLDRTLESAARFHYAAWVIAALGLLQALSASFAARLPHGTAVGLALVVVALSFAADKLVRSVAPYRARDRRGPPAGWLFVGGGDASATYASVWLLAPPALAGVAAMCASAPGLAGIDLLIAPPILVVVLRGLDAYGTLVLQRKDESGEGARLSSWLIYCSHLGKCAALAALLGFWMLAALPRVAQPMALTALVFGGAFMLAWLFGVVVRSTYRRFDRLGARFGFLVWQSEIPGSEFVGKPVAQAMKIFGVRYEALDLIDEPAGKLRTVGFAATIDGERVPVRLHLKYNAKRLFSVERSWEQAAVLEAEIAKLEYGMPEPKPVPALVEDPKKKVAAQDITLPRLKVQLPERPRGREE